jgi:hypothetical protein
MSESYVEQLQQRLRESEERERGLQWVIDALVAAGHVSQEKVDQASDIGAALAQPQGEPKPDIVAVDHEGKPVYALSDAEFARMNPAQPQGEQKQQP